MGTTGTSRSQIQDSAARQIRLLAIGPNDFLCHSKYVLLTALKNDVNGFRSTEFRSAE